MNSGFGNGWRELIEEHIASNWDDSCRRAGLCLSGLEAQFLEEHGSEVLRAGLRRAVAERQEMIARSARPIYSVIEESAVRVIVEVKSSNRWPDGLSIPLQTMRVHLASCNSEWQIAEIFQACMSCNLSERYDRRSTTSDISQRGAPGKCVVEPAPCLHENGTACTVMAPDFAQSARMKISPGGVGALALTP